MNRFKCVTKPLPWFMALLLTAIVAGCGGDATDPILGGGGAVKQADARPRVSLTNPVADAPAVATNTKITATFSEAMAPATISTASFTLTCGSPCVSPTGNTVSYAVGGKTATLTPGAVLESDTLYTATITTAATDLTDNALAGNQAPLPAASDYVWMFTTSAALDVIAPTISSTNPVDGASNVALNSSINATFDKAMDQSTINATTFTVQGVSGPALAGTFSYDAVANVTTFTPSSNLTAGAVYTATITSGVAGVKDLAGNELAAGLAPNPWTFTTNASGVLAPGAVALGTAGTFGIMATAAVTAASASIINGDVSLEPGTSMTGFPPAIVNGAVHINDSVSAQARNDLLAAYNYAKGLASDATTPDGADLGAWTPPGSILPPGSFPPGVYTNGSTMAVNTTLTLDAGGNANAVWVFQIGSSLTTTTGGDVLLANGALSKNVFWVPTSDATIGSGTTFNGTIVTGRNATSEGSATINGRILAGAILAGTIALDGPASTINVPAP